jgi:hypothetical protein
MDEEIIHVVKLPADAPIMQGYCLTCGFPDNFVEFKDIKTKDGFRFFKCRNCNQFYVAQSVIYVDGN